MNDECVVTQAMLDAAYYRLAFFDRESDSVEEVLTQIYHAMETARQAAQKARHCRPLLPRESCHRSR